MNLKLPVLAVLAAALVTSTGCITMGNMTTASALPEGESQFNLEPNLWGANGGMLPTFSVSGRYGVTDRFELGGRAGLGGFELLTKFQLTDPTSDFVVSLAPSGGGFVLVGADGEGSGSGGFLSASLPLLFGFRSAAGEFVVGPKLHDMVLFAGASADGTESSGAINIFSVGGTIGYAFRLGDLVLMPELALLRPIYASAGATVDGDSGSVSDFVSAEGVLMQFSFAMMFGG